jgi:alkylation response protein AidB-like acyl-CoA dehydrogenase
MIQLNKSEEKILERVDKACNAVRKSEEETYLKGVFNRDRIRIFQKYDLLGIPIEKKYGGLGSSLLTYVLALKRIGEEGSTLRTFFSVHISIGQLTLQQFGTEEQKKKYLRKTTKGKMIMGFALTEPLAGSNPAGMKTNFTEKGDNFILNGQKKWIGHATIGDVFTTYAKDRKGIISAFIVEKNSEGFSSKRQENTLGLRNHDVGEINFKNCKIPKENLLGAKGKGLHIAYDTLLNGRLSVAAGSVGVMQDCLKESVNYSRKRIMHGKKIGKHQLIQRHIAKISTNLEAAQWLTVHAALAKIAYIENKTKETRSYADAIIAKAKYFTSNASFDAADRAVQIHGGNGYDLRQRVARHFLDERVTRIYEGTNEILEQKIAVDVLGKDYEAYG